MRGLLTLLAALGLTGGAGLAAEPAPEDRDPFKRRRWSLAACGGFNFGDAAKGEMASGHLGVGYQVLDDLGLHLDAFGAYVRSGIDDDGAAIGADLTIRWHVLRLPDRRGTLFLDAAAGLQQASTHYSGSRHFNFRLHPGIGLTLDSGPIHLLGGARYLHISDAAVAGGGGGGFDGVFVYLGVLLPR